MLASFLNTEAPPIFRNSQWVKPTLGLEYCQLPGLGISAPCDITRGCFSTGFLKGRPSEEHNSYNSPEFFSRAENHVAAGLDTFVCSRFRCEGTTGPFPFLSDKAERVPEQVRCGKRRTPGLPCSHLLIVSPSLPKHHSHSPTGASLTLNICPTLPLPWQRVGQCDGHKGGAASAAKCFQTSRSAVICEPWHLSLNLFVFNLPGLFADVRGA